MTTTPAGRGWRIRLALLGGCLALLAAAIWWGTRDTKPSPDETGAAPKPLTLDHLDPTAIPAEQRWPGAPAELVAVLGDPRGRHDGAVRSVAFSPDGKRLASGGDDGHVRLWNAETLQELEALNTQQLAVSHVVFSGDGKLLAAVCGNFQGDRGVTVRLWNVTETRAELVAMLPGHARGGANPLAVTVAGDRLAACAPDGKVRLWDVTGPAPKQLAEWCHDASPVEGGGCLAVAFAPDGKTLFTAGDGGPKAAVRRWDITKLPPQAQGGLPAKPGRASGLAIDAAGKTLAIRYLWPTSAARAEVWRLDGEQFQELASTTLFPIDENLIASALAPEGRTLALAGENLYWFDINPKEKRQAAFQPTTKINSIAFSPDSKRCVIGDEAGQVRVLEIQGNGTSKTLPETTAADQTIVHPDGRILAVSHAGSGVVQVWNLEKKQPVLVRSIRAKGLGQIAFGREGQALFVSERHRGLQVWNLTEGRLEEGPLLQLGEVKSPARLVLAPGGTRAVQVLDGPGKGVRQTLVWWDLTEKTPGKIQLELNHLVSPLVVNDRAVAGMVAKDSGDFEVRLWEPRGQTLEKRVVVPLPTAARALALAADGKRLALSCGDGQTSVWDLSGEKPAEKVKLQGKTAPLAQLAFGPGGKIVAGAVGGQVLLWDAVTGRRLGEWNFSTRVNGLTLAPDGRHLITANANGTVFILRLSKLRAR